MLKKLFLTSFLLFILIGVTYPSQNENTKLFAYCYSLEKILSRNSIQTKKNVSGKVKSISKDIAKFGVNKTRGALINMVIDQYKESRNTILISFFHNEFYCFGGYWIEKFKPGIFESIFFNRTNNKINEFKNFKNEVNELIHDINSEYNILKKEFKHIF